MTPISYHTANLQVNNAPSIQLLKLCPWLEGFQMSRFHIEYFKNMYYVTQNREVLKGEHFCSFARQVDDVFLTLCLLQSRQKSSLQQAETLLRARLFPSHGITKLSISVYLYYVISIIVFTLHNKKILLICYYPWSFLNLHALLLHPHILHFRFMLCLPPYIYICL